MHHTATNASDDLFFKVAPSQFRLYEPGKDPAPIYELVQGDVVREEQLTAEVDEEQGAEALPGSSEFLLERDLQRYLAENLECVEPGLKLYEDDDIKGFEFEAGGGRRIDILAVDKGGAFVVLELKVSRGYDRVVGQLLRYVNWVRQNLAEPELSAGDVHLWVVPVHYDFADINSPAAWLDASELTSFNQLLFERDRLLYAQAHAWLRRIVSDYLGCEPNVLRFRCRADGKPVIDAPVTMPKLHFSLSHTHSGVLIGLSTDGDMGVDLEKVRPLKDFAGMFDSVLRSSEKRELERESLPGERLATFFRFWTAKEAYTTKALGSGLAHGFRNISVALQRPSGCLLQDGVHRQPQRGQPSLFQFRYEPGAA